MLNPIEFRLRKKLRDSDLIRKLLKSGLTFRQISTIAKASHGSVSAEKQAMVRGEREHREKIAAQAAAEAELERLVGAFPEMPKA